MKIRCKICRDYFYPDDETLALMSDGYLATVEVNTCDECWDLLNQLPIDPMDMISNTDPGL